ncbi:MAG: leucine-rich repeat domain-containing protein, partial [Clostridia bacterium]|nr:leucine-rich repeat domain-containing protein [Clostridia bacterium]
SSTVGTATWQDSYSNSRYTYYYRAQLPETLKKVTVRGGEISSFKTLKNLSLETLVLGENVTVSNDPLSQIGSVQNLTLPQAAFEGYKPTAVASIKNLTFNQYDGSEFVSHLSGLTSLETLNLPDGVTEFSPAYFSGAPYTLTVNFAENDRYVFDQGNIIDVTTNTVIVGFNAMTLPEYVTAIGENAYVDRFGLTEVIIPATVETVDKTAFANCRITVLTAAADKLNAVMTDYVVHLHITGGESFPNMQHYTALETLTIDGDFTALPEKFMQSHKIIKSVTINADVTEIGAYAFGSCSALESVTFSDALIRLGDSAFASCSSLTSVTLPKNLTALPAYAFYNCTRLENLVWNDGLQSVGAYAIYGAKLTEIELPNTVTSIGEYSFANNSLLETFTPSNQLTTLPAYFLSNTKVTELVIPDGVTAVEENAFANFNLKTLTVGKGFQALPENFISNHATLQTVILPETLVSIGASAFSGCTALKDLELPQSLVEIGANAFSGCTALTEISLPATLSTIGESAFSGASRLNSVTIPSLESWLSLSLANGASSPACNKANLILSGEPITELVIPETVTELRNYAFCNVAGLTNVDLANVTKIGAHAFSGAEIAEIDLKNVKTVENYAFSNSAVATVNFRNVETIGTHAFYNTKLTEARLPNSLKSLGTSAFAYCKDLTVFDTGDGLTKIEDGIIEKNYNLTNVTYQP